jgi:hypothetical protein
LLYLLDADTVITGEKRAYPLHRFALFWDWLCHMGSEGNVKIPREQYDEIVAGRGPIVDWLKLEQVRNALVLSEEVDPAIVASVIERGYAPDLNEEEVDAVGRDPFLIAYAVVDVDKRTVVSFETSAPTKQRANRKVPDVCATFRVPCCTLYDLINALDFTLDWRPQLR